MAELPAPVPSGTSWRSEERRRRWKIIWKSWGVLSAMTVVTLAVVLHGPFGVSKDSWNSIIEVRQRRAPNRKEVSVLFFAQLGWQIRRERVLAWAGGIVVLGTLAGLQYAMRRRRRVRNYFLAAHAIVGAVLLFGGGMIVIQSLQLSRA